MEWVIEVEIVYVTKDPLEFRGLHNSQWNSLVLRLRSDGKPFFLVKVLKVTREAHQVMKASRDVRWVGFMKQNVDVPSMTEEEFLDDAEKRRVELNGAYV